MTRQRALALLLPLLAGCASTATEPAGEQYSGFYSAGFEVESFEPCGSDEAWWVTNAAELRARYRDAGAGDYQRVFVVLRGVVGPEGKFGHLGAYDRELSVREVVALRPARQGDCG